MNRKSLTLLLSALLVLAVALAGCAAPAPAGDTGEATAPEAEMGDNSPLVIAIAEDTVSYDPQRAFETLPTIVHKATYDTLVTFPDGNVGSIEPELAESWEISDDGTVYTFTLADGPTFSNGDPVIASDVVFSFNRLANLAGNPSFLAETIASVEAPDDKTVVLTLTQPDPSILAKLVFDAFGIASQKMVEEQGGTAGEDAATADTAEEWLNQNSAGSGPYVLESWEPTVETVLVRNDNYWGEAPAIEKIIIRNTAEAATQKIQLEAGDIDIAMDLTADQIPSLEGSENVTIFQDLSDTLIFLKGNNDPDVGGAMSDPLVQKAVRYAIDYDGVRALGGGESVIPASVIPAGFLGAYDADSGISQDIEQAKALLAEAGYPDGLDVELAYPDFTFVGVNFGTFAQKVQADLNEAGFNATLAPAEVGVALEAYRQGTEPFGLWLWLPDYRDPLDYVEFLPEGVVGLRTMWNDENADQAIKDLRDAVKVETDDATRAEMFGEIQDYLMESGPYAPILQPGMQIGLNSDLKGFVYNPQWRVDVSLLSK